MNRRQKIIISVTGIFLVLLILVGLTYAFFVTRVRGNEKETSVDVVTAKLIVEYTDGDSNGDGETVASGNLVVGTHQILLNKVDINVSEVHTYTLSIKYDEAGIDQSVDMNKALSFKVDIDTASASWDTAT